MSPPIETRVGHPVAPAAAASAARSAARPLPVAPRSRSTSRGTTTVRVVGSKLHRAPARHRPEGHGQRRQVGGQGREVDVVAPGPQRGRDRRDRPARRWPRPPRTRWPVPRPAAVTPRRDPGVLQETAELGVGAEATAGQVHGLDRRLGCRQCGFGLVRLVDEHDARGAERSELPRPGLSLTTRPTTPTGDVDCFGGPGPGVRWWWASIAGPMGRPSSRARTLSGHSCSGSWQVPSIVDPTEERARPGAGAGRPSEKGGERPHGDDRATGDPDRGRPDCGEAVVTSVRCHRGHSVGRAREERSGRSKSSVRTSAARRTGARRPGVGRLGDGAEGR